MLRAAFLFVTLTALVGVAMAVPGEDCSDPFDVTSLPVVLSGNTCSFLDDYEWACPYETEAVDVVYRYVPSIGQNVNFSLCSASYDTKLFVFENSCSSDPIACDDDGSGFCADASHAFIQGLALTAGYTYFIVVEGGYGFQCGDYELTISEHYPDRPCQSCTPVDADLGSITSITCGDSISGNLGSGGKWVASFTGEAGVTYVWDLCPGGTCPGYDNFGSDPDFIILDETCSILEWTDGQEWCSYRPDEWTWACQANGTYYIVVGSYPSISDDTLTCNGTGSDAFTMYYYARPGRLCASCTPVNADLGDITTAPCGASVTGDCGWGGKWIASFIGYQDVVYHWDLCAMEPCSGASEFGGTDADVVILDANCAIVEWHDGMEECGYRPNDYQWTCPASGNYYVVIAPYPAVQEDTLTCAGQADQTFTLVYWRDEGPIPGGETCDDATLISGPLPRTIRWNTCSYVNDYDVECWQGTDNGARDVVYQYVPDVDEFVTFNLCGAMFDAKLYVFADFCTGTPWACNDIDLTGTCSEPMWPYLPCVELPAGHTYYIVVDAVNEWECGDFTLEMSPCTPIEGDVIQTAWTIPSLPFSDTGSTVGFYDQYVEDCGGFSYSRDVVYAYTPASSGLVEIDLAMSQFSTRIYVYENSRENLFACDNDGGPGGRAYITGMTMYAGNTYYIVVEGDWELHGTYVLDILEPTVGRCCTPTGGCHDDVTSRQCSYHLGHGTWSEGLTCAASCPTLPPPPPGPIDSATVPVNNGCLYGITLASVCDGRLFYNNTCSDTLYTTNKDGDRLAAVAVTFNGWGSWFSTGCWDETRGQLWASRDDKQICLLDPVTGILTEQFSTPRGTWDMDLDPSDGTLWLHEPEGNLIYHYSTDGTLLGQIFPLDTNGNVDGTLRGVCSGIENTVYVSHNDGRITRHDKATGAWRGLFASSNVWQSRALACDAFSFAPQTVIWWKFDTTYYAYAVPAGTCICPGCPPADSVTIMLNAARTNVVVNFFAPVAGTYRIDTCATTNTIYPAGFSEAGSIEAVLGRNQWTDPTAPGSFKRYVVVHVCDGTETRP